MDHFLQLLFSFFDEEVQVEKTGESMRIHSEKYDIKTL